MVEAIAAVVDRAPENTGTDAPDPEVDPAVLARDRRRHPRRRVAPLRLPRHDPGSSSRTGCSSWQRRWYLVGRDPQSGEWASSAPTGSTRGCRTRRRFAPTPLPGGDYTAFAMRSIAIERMEGARAPPDRRARPTAVLARINPAVGVVEAVSDDESVLVTGADSLDTIAAYIGMLGMDFTVESPAELVPLLRTLSERYARAAAT